MYLESKCVKINQKKVETTLTLNNKTLTSINHRFKYFSWYLLFRNNQIKISSIIKIHKNEIIIQKNEENAITTTIFSR
jgi:predicted nuclease of restriction endonuclease-like RecB superfamily